MKNGYLNIFAVVISLLTLVITSSCVPPSTGLRHRRPPRARVMPPPPPVIPTPAPVVVAQGPREKVVDAAPVHVQPGPPAHAVARGKRAKMRMHPYTYYPALGVYFDPYRKMYFYKHRGAWVMRASLPRHINVRSHQSIAIEVDGDKPYVFHNHHLKQYPPGHYKGKYKEKNKHHRGKGNW